MTTLSIYQESVVLDRREHRSLRLKKQAPTEFAKNFNAVPIAGIEFFEAGRELPVVFNKGEAGEFIPLALLSLRPKGNNIGDNWGDIYMPAFIRRHPFALAEGRVVFDKHAPQLQEKEGEPLFMEDGKNTEFLNKIMEFLVNMDAQFKTTREYCRACAENGFFTPFKAQVTDREGKRMRLDNLFVIDEKKFHGLPDERITEWFRKGWLAWSYAHLHSLGAVPRLLKREQQAASTRRTASAVA